MELDHQPAHMKSEEPVTVTPKPLLSVIIPVYNEIKTIAEVIARVRAVPLSTEIILVNDGSTDGTGEFLEPEGNKPMTVVCNSLINLGKGSAVRIGLERVQGEIVIIQDADLELDPAEFPKLIKPIQEGQTDVVFGSRFLGRGLFGRVPNFPLVPWLGNKIIVFTTNVLYGAQLTDVETAYKVCRASVINSIKLDSKGFELEPELTAKLLRLGYGIIEVPISYQPRKRSEGKKIGWIDGFKAIYYLFKYRFQSVHTFLR